MTAVAVNPPSPETRGVNTQMRAPLETCSRRSVVAVLASGVVISMSALTGGVAPAFAKPDHGDPVVPIVPTTEVVAPEAPQVVPEEQAPAEAPRAPKEPSPPKVDSPPQQALAPEIPAPAPQPEAPAPQPEAPAPQIQAPPPPKKEELRVVEAPKVDAPRLTCRGLMRPRLMRQGSMRPRSMRPRLMRRRWTCRRWTRPRLLQSWISPLRPPGRSWMQRSRRIWRPASRPNRVPTLRTRSSHRQLTRRNQEPRVHATPKVLTRPTHRRSRRPRSGSRLPSPKHCGRQSRTSSSPSSRNRSK